MVHRVQRDIAGKTLTLESGLLAGQAHGAVTLRLGDTVLLTTVVMSSPRAGIDFFPLTVEFEERFYAAGKIPGSFFKREGRPSTEATLAARLTDRPIRPLFPKGFRNEVQVISTVLSADRVHPPDILSIVGASAALTLSHIPFQGPISGCRVGYVDGEFVVNPTFEEIAASKLDLIIASSQDAVVMVEAGAKEVPESLLLEAMDRGIQANREIIAMVRELAEAVGVPAKMEYSSPTGYDPQVEEAVTGALNGRLRAAVFSGKEKGERDTELAALEREVVASSASSTRRRTQPWPSTPWCEGSSGRASWSAACAPTGEAPATFAPSAAPWAFCPGRTVPASSPAGRRRSSAPSPWALLGSGRSWTR